LSSTISISSITRVESRLDLSSHIKRVLMLDSTLLRRECKRLVYQAQVHPKFFCCVDGAHASTPRQLASLIAEVPARLRLPQVRLKAALMVVPWLIPHSSSAPNGSLPRT
jgi:hypothetical protein